MQRDSTLGVHQALPSRGLHLQLYSTQEARPAALYRSVLVRMRFHQPSIDYVRRRTAESQSKREIIRCLKRYLARESTNVS